MSVEIKNSLLVNPSPKLKKYLEKITRETSCQIIFEFDPNSGDQFQDAVFLIHPQVKDIIIKINREGKFKERKIAHEVTHGYLIFRHNYCIIIPTPVRFPVPKISFINSVISDIVIEKILESEGFGSMPPKLISDLKARKKPQILFAIFSNDFNKI